MEIQLSLEQANKEICDYYIKTGYPLDEFMSGNLLLPDLKRFFGMRNRVIDNLLQTNTIERQKLWVDIAYEYFSIFLDKNHKGKTHNIIITFPAPDSYMFLGATV